MIAYKIDHYVGMTKRDKQRVYYVMICNEQGCKDAKPSYKSVALSFRRFFHFCLLRSFFFLYYILRHGFAPAKIYRMAKYAFAGAYDNETILKWLRTFFRRFFIQQFKRSCLPDGPKVGTVSVSPRGDWQMPSDAVSALWLKEIDALKP